MLHNINRKRNLPFGKSIDNNKVFYYIESRFMAKEAGESLTNVENRYSQLKIVYMHYHYSIDVITKYCCICRNALVINLSIE